MSDKYIATLVEGNVYYLGDTRFEEGIGKVVDENQKNHLEEYAVDRIAASNGKLILEPKFSFEAIPEDINAAVGTDAEPIQALIAEKKASKSRSRPKADGSDA